MPRDRLEVNMPLGSSRRHLRLLLLPALAVGVLSFAGEAPDDASLSAGTFTIPRFDRQAFSGPAPVLTVKERQIFMTGRSVFNR